LTRRPFASMRVANRVVRIARDGAIRRTPIKACGDSKFQRDMR
jgi:hypothetical protein